MQRLNHISYANKAQEVAITANKIKQAVAKGYRYKDIAVYVGDVESYRNLVTKEFAKREIPSYYSAKQKMSSHPLTLLFETLKVIKLTNFRLDDLNALVATGLYQPNLTDKRYKMPSADDLDYALFLMDKYGLGGRKRVLRTFESLISTTGNVPNQVKLADKAKELYFGEQSPLQVFLSSAEEEPVEMLNNSLLKFLTDCGVAEAFQKTVNASEDPNFREREKMVWKTLVGIVKQINLIMSNQEMKVVEYLDIIVSGLKDAEYRQIPASIDCIIIRDFELVEPNSKKLAFILGIGRNNFPRLASDNSLLTIADKQTVNDMYSEDRFVIKQTSSLDKTNRLLGMLTYSGTESVTFSEPRVVDNAASSSYNPLFDRKDLLPELEQMTFQKVAVGVLDNANPLDFISTPRMLVGQLATVNQQLMKGKVSNPFWETLYRLTVKSDERLKALTANVTRDIATSQLSQESLDAIERAINHVSVSSMETFYNCEYRYFLQNILHLRVPEKNSYNSKVIGDFFHEIAQKLMTGTYESEADFSKQLKLILTASLAKYQMQYKQTEIDDFISEKLTDMVNQTVTVLKSNIFNSAVETKGTETSFDQELNKQTKLVGRIDRIDELSGTSVGAIDYKSGSKKFSEQEARDSLNIQLLTYLDILRKQYPDKEIFGGLYLRFQIPTVKLDEVDSLGAVKPALNKKMNYQGVIVSEQKDEVQTIGNVNLPSKQGGLVEQDKLSLLLDNTENLYKRGADIIQSGMFQINPATDFADHTALGCAWCPYKSICRFEADRHLSLGRAVNQKPQ